MAGALFMLEGRTDLPPPMRLAWASEGRVKEAMLSAMMEAVAENEVFKRKFLTIGKCSVS